jgi:hypothetical protein
MKNSMTSSGRYLNENKLIFRNITLFSHLMAENKVMVTPGSEQRRCVLFQNSTRKSVTSRDTFVPRFWSERIRMNFEKLTPLCDRIRLYCCHYLFS